MDSDRPNLVDNNITYGLNSEEIKNQGLNTLHSEYELSFIANPEKIKQEINHKVTEINNDELCQRNVT